MDDLFERPKTYIQWMLGNNCNYNCSYCPEMFHIGDRSKITNDILLEVCKDITYHYDELGRDVVFEFLGGEPTLQDCIPEIGRRLSNFPTSIILRTNGSASLEWWQKARSVIGGVVISVHREFADINHIKSVVEYLQDPEKGYPIPIEVLFPVTHRSESFDWGITQLKKFQNQYGVGTLQMLYSNFGRGSSIYMPYTDDQWEKYYELNPYANSSEKPDGLYRYQPSFTGHRCYAGIDTLTIDPEGSVRRGWCQQGGILGNVYDGEVSWPRDPIICQKDFCHNGFDRIAKKEII